MDITFRNYVIRYLSDEDFNYIHITDLFKEGGMERYQIFEMISFLELTELDADLRKAFRNYYIKLYLDYHGIRYCGNLLDEKYVAMGSLYPDKTFDGYSIDNLPLKELDEYLNREDYNKFINGDFPQTFDEAIKEIIEGLNKEDVVTIKSLSKPNFLFKSYYTLGMNIKNEYVKSRKNIVLLDFIKDEYGIKALSDEIIDLFLDRIWETIHVDYDNNYKKIKVTKDR